MIAFNICLSKTSYKDIPYATIRESLRKEIASNVFPVKENQIQDFVRSLGEEGYYFCSATFQNGKNLPKPIIYRKGFGKNLSRLKYMINFCSDFSSERFIQSATSNRPYRSDAIKSISFNCKLYHEFESAKSERKLTFRELLGLVTNLAHVETEKKYL